MTRTHADYVYRNQHDSLRVRVHRKENGRWDYDVFYPSGKIEVYSVEAGDDFVTKRNALAEANAQHGPLHAIAGAGNVVDAAWYRRASAPARSHSTRKTAAQLTREITTALAARDRVHSTIGKLTWVTEDRLPGLTPITHTHGGAYVIKHAAAAHTVAYRMPSGYQHIGSYKTPVEAKAAADRHAKTGHAGRETAAEQRVAKRQTEFNKKLAAGHTTSAYARLLHKAQDDMELRKAEYNRRARGVQTS